MQHTMIWLALAAFLLVRTPLNAMPNAAHNVGVTESVWPVARPEKLYIEGTMTVSSPSLGFEQSASFTAAVRGDTVLMTALGPFGIVVARVYAQPDSFLVVNYLQQTAVDGDPRSSRLNDLLPIPVRLDDILSIMKCMPPGTPSEYIAGESRNDGSALYTRRDSTMVEFALIDSTQRVIKQFQRKKSDGTSLLNVQYGNVQPVEGSDNVPHRIKVRVNDGEHEVDVVYDEVTTEAPSIKGSVLKVPRSFTRTSLR